MFGGNTQVVESIQQKGFADDAVHIIEMSYEIIGVALVVLPKSAPFLDHLTVFGWNIIPMDVLTTDSCKRL